jgi:hypothetical protein
MTQPPKRTFRPPAPGDVVVTPVARHYHVGRVQTGTTVVSSITVANHLADAIAHATTAATGRQRLFLFEHAGSLDCVEIDLRPLIAVDPDF